MIDKLRLRIPGILIILAGLMLWQILFAMWQNGGTVILREPNPAILGLETASVVILIFCGAILCISPGRS